MPKTSVTHTDTGMTLVASFATLAAVHAVVLLLAHYFFPTQVVLGTHSMSLYWALFHSTLIFTVITTFAIPFAHLYENMRKKMLVSHEWMVLYAVLNFVALWVITRYSEQFGLGISAWWVVAILALVLDVVQGAAMMFVEKMRT